MNGKNPPDPAVFVLALMIRTCWFSRHRPLDIRAKDFRAIMAKVQDKHKTDFDPERNRRLVETYINNLPRFRPVMRHFFVEKKKEPIAWFAMRLAYARSLAVTNIVGFILGIGDRHCSNILIDRSTGELVHIDFGVAFGQVSRVMTVTSFPGQADPKTSGEVTSHP